MRKQKLFTTLLLVTLLVASILVACAQQPPPTPEIITVTQIVEVEGETQYIEVTSTPAPTEATSQEPEPVTLQVWYTEHGRDAAYNAYDGLIAKFEETYPWIDVEVTLKSAGVYQEALTTAALAGEPPDVTNVLANWAQQYIAQGAMLPITDIADKIGPEKYGKAAEVSFALDGEWYALPIFTFPHVVWYRTDLFAEKGLEPPETWEEMLAAAKALTEDTNGDGTIDRYGLAMSMQVSGFENNYAVQFGVDTNNALLLDEDGNPVVTQPGNNERVVEALDYIKELKTCCMADGNLNWLQTDTRNVFLAGEAAMMVSSTSFVYNIQRDNPDMLDKVSTFAWPYNANNPDAESQNFWAAWGMGIMKTARHPEEAKLFVEFFHDYDNLLWFMQTTVNGWLPPRSDMAEADAYWEHENVAWTAPIIREAGAYAATHGQVLGMNEGPNPWAGIFYGRQLWGQLWYNLIVEDMTPADAANWLQTEMESIIAEGL